MVGLLIRVLKQSRGGGQNSLGAPSECSVYLAGMELWLSWYSLGVLGGNMADDLGARWGFNDGLKLVMH